jgi:hypothetical protein
MSHATAPTNYNQLNPDESSSFMDVGGGGGGGPINNSNIMNEYNLQALLE